MFLFKMMKRVFIVMLFTLPALYVGAEVLAKNFAEKTLAENAKAHDPVATSTSAKVSSPLIWGLLRRSTIDEIQITADHVQLGDLLADETTAVLRGVHINVQESIRQSEPIIDRIDQLDVSLNLSQDEVNKLMPQGFSFNFGPGDVTLIGPGFADRGLLKATTDGIIYESASARRVGIPAIGIGEALASCVQNIEIGPGAIKITCSKKDPPANFPPFPGKARG